MIESGKRRRHGLQSANSGPSSHTIKEIKGTCPLTTRKEEMGVGWVSGVGEKDEKEKGRLRVLVRHGVETR